MLTVALTGGIGSGKTAVTEIFQQLGREQGLKIIDSDIIARHLLAGSLHESPSEALLSVHSLFGSDLFNETGHLERAKLRELVFASESKKKQLEALLHPLVYKEIFSQIGILSKTFSKEKPSVNIIIIAIPLLFETHSENLFDRVLVIDVPEKLQIARSVQRDQCSHELIEQIIASQIARQIRLDKADDIIDNSGDWDELQEQVEKLYHFYCSLEK